MLFSLSASNTLKRDYKNQKVGTPFYLAPELWLTETNNLCSKQSDIWSLGVILYELCTQKKPFQAQDKHTLSQKVLKEKYAPIPMSVNQNFTELIAKCLQKKPEKRPLIDEIIQNEIFQQKAKQLKIKLPVITTAASGGTDLKASQNDQKGQIAAKSSIAKDLKRSSIIEEPIVELKKAQTSGVKATQVQPQEGGLKPLEALGSKKSSESEPSVISQGRPSLKPLATKTITKSRDESPNQLKSGNKSERKLTSTPLGHHQRIEQSQLIEEIEDMRNHASSTLEIERPQHLIAASNSPPLKRTIFGAREKAQAGIFSIEKQGLAEKTDKPNGRLSHLNMRQNQPSEEKTADEAHPFPIVQSTPTHMHGYIYLLIVEIRYPIPFKLNKKGTSAQTSPNNSFSGKKFHTNNHFRDLGEALRNKQWSQKERNNRWRVQYECSSHSYRRKLVPRYYSQKSNINQVINCKRGEESRFKERLRCDSYFRKQLEKIGSSSKCRQAQGWKRKYKFSQFAHCASII